MRKLGGCVSLVLLVGALLLGCQDRAAEPFPFPDGPGSSGPVVVTGTTVTTPGDGGGYERVRRLFSATIARVILSDGELLP